MGSRITRFLKELTTKTLLSLISLQNTTTLAGAVHIYDTSMSTSEFAVERWNVEPLLNGTTRFLWQAD